MPIRRGARTHAVANDARSPKSRCAATKVMERGAKILGVDAGAC